MRCPPTLGALACLGLLVLSSASAAAADWPMWRYDAARTAASPQELAERLHLQWVREYPRLQPAWPDQPKMPFDIAYEPVVVGTRMFVGSSRHDNVTALDTRTGAELWRFPADGPVRFAPLCWEDRVYFVSDDGFLYGLDAASGKLVWKFRGGPADRRILGNERLIATWPARGAPVIAPPVSPPSEGGDTGGVVYFAAGIWPFMGIFIHALDARTGKVVWTNDGDGSLYMKQPHNAESFAGVAPQGPLVVAGDYLLIPGGRSVPACYDRKTGKLIHYLLAENSKKGGGSEVATIGNLYLNGGRVFDLRTGKLLAELPSPVVLAPEAIYSYYGAKCRGYDVKSSTTKTEESVDRKGEKTATSKWTITPLGTFDGPKAETLIKAGSRLYGSAANRIFAFEPPLEKDGTPAITWQHEIEGTPVSLLAADDRLFAVTLEGRIYCFGPEQAEPKRHAWNPTPPEPADQWTAEAKAILETTGVREGYCVVFGVGASRLITELVRQSDLRIIAVESDLKKAATVRDQLIAAGLYGERVAVHHGDPRTFPLPPYLASLVVVPDLGAEGQFNLDLQKAFQVLRPYGGVAWLRLLEEQRKDFESRVKDAGLANAKVRIANGQVRLSREGPLSGAANWTHEHADAANTRVSKDRLVKAPLGLLWFGGPSHDGILPRHGHGPQPQIVDGRVLIEGIDLIRAMDIYTGRILWETSLPGVGTYYNNLAHQPGANASGTNFISTSDGIYVALGRSCLRLDSATGKKLSEFQLPMRPGATEPPTWGYLNVCDDYLIGGADPLFDPSLFKPSIKVAVVEPKLPGQPDPKPEPPKNPPLAENPLQKLLSKLPKPDNDNFSSSKHLVVMDRHTGRALWTAAAQDGFRHNAICVGGGRLYAIDRLSGAQVARLKRRGELPTDKPRLVVFDLATGRELWSTEADVFGTWLSYSAKHDVLVESGRNARDTLSDEPKGMRAYSAKDGTVLWSNKSYVGPAMIHGDTILKDLSACDLLTGKPKLRPDPLTGEAVEWTWCRNYGCNTPAASEHLLTFRSGAAGYFDLTGDSGTGNLGGFRSSCTNNLIVAGGVLCAPDYTRTCICSYQNQTSLALVHMPEAEIWTYFGGKSADGPIRRLGINLGAPGDRRAEDGTLWIEYPSVGGRSPAVPIKVTPEKPIWFRRHSTQIDGEGLKWVAASGARGLTSLTVTLDDQAKEERPYTVRLHFAEPDDRAAGDRVFSAALQGTTVLKDFDVAREAAGSRRIVVKEFKGIQVLKDLTLTFTSTKGDGVILSGIEVQAEGW